MIPVPELQRLGFKMVIFPVSALLTVCQAVSNLMQELKAQGTTANSIQHMVSLESCFETVGLSEMLALDARYSQTPQITS